MSDLSAQFQEALDRVVAAEQAPGATVIAFNRDRILAQASAGVRDVGSKEPWTESSVFWPASQGKAAVSVICLAVANDVGIGLDDHSIIQYLPEFSKAKGGIMSTQLVDWDLSNGVEKRKMVLKDFPNGEPKITLRQLLDHTAGIGYWFTDAKTLQAYNPEGEGAKLSQLSGKIDSFTIPPVNEPGTKWMYGMGVDWAVQFAIRASGKSLRQLANEKITGPLGIAEEDLSPWLTPSMEANVVPIHANIAPKTFVPTPLRITQYEGMPPEGEAVLGSAPFYATNKGYARFLQALLKEDGDGLLPPALFKAAIADSLAPRGISVTNPVCVSGDPASSYTVGDYSLAAGTGKQDLGWTCLQTMYERAESSTGRSKGTLSWSGLANGHYMVDREKGVGLFVNAQFLPFGDQHIMARRDTLEKVLYASLKA